MIPLVAPDPAVLLRYHFLPGKVQCYEFVMKSLMSAGGGKAAPASGSFTVTQKVLSVAPDGTATLEIHTQPGETTVNGKSVKTRMSRAFTMTLQVTPRGESKGEGDTSRALSALGGLDPRTLAFGASFPAYPVQVGSMWSSSVLVPQLGRIEMHSKLEQLGKPGADIVAVIHVNCAIDLWKLLGGKLSERNTHPAIGDLKLSILERFNVTKGVLEEMFEDDPFTANLGASRPPLSGEVAMRATLVR